MHSWLKKFPHWFFEAYTSLILSHYLSLAQKQIIGKHPSAGRTEKEAQRYMLSNLHFGFSQIKWEISFPGTVYSGFNLCMLVSDYCSFIQMQVTMNALYWIIWTECRLRVACLDMVMDMDMARPDLLLYASICIFNCLMLQIYA